MDKKAGKSSVEVPKRMIAIVTGIDSYNDDHYTNFIAQYITDWDEVTEEEYKNIQTWLTRKAYKGWATRSIIIERTYLNNVKEDILTTVKEAKKEATKYKLEQEEKKKQKLLKRQEQTVKQEKKLLEELKAKYETTISKG